MRPGRGLPIFWATLLLLLASLAASQGVTIALFALRDPPRPDFNRLGDIADALAGRDHERRGGRERGLLVERHGTAPPREAVMTSDRRFTAMLAERIGLPPGAVRLYFEPDQRGGLGSRRPSRGLVPIRRGEPLFYGTVLAAADTGAGWRVVHTPRRPLFPRWQVAMMLRFALSALLVVPFAWFFARRITRPISRIAAAADRLGHDPLAPRLAEEGPAELRVTARALNLMQDRIAAYVAERTAMIGAIAHDLRTPLARIAFRIEGAPEPVRDKVQDDIEQMRAMIAATIGFVRGSTRGGAMAPVDLAHLLGTLVAAEQEMGRPAKLGAVAPATVTGDALALGRLVQNLVDNGIAYGAAVILSLACEGSEAVIRVADRGPGVAAERLEQLFDPFERGDPSRNRATGGIGLGLTIARSIAREHGGSVMLRNRDGGGLEAVCRLPLAREITPGQKRL